MSHYDFIAIGGGAAGFFGAIAFAESFPGAKVCILEKTSAVLGKVKISGGGRCNVTHACYEAKRLTTHYPRGERNLIGPFHRFGATETVAWFAKRGVELKTEADGRIFPVTDNSQTIINCLLEAASESGIEVHYHSEVDRLDHSSGKWCLDLKDGTTMTGRSVLLATGGIRNNAGVRLAGNLGHEIVPSAPSLFTFKIPDRRLEGLAGIAVDSAVATIPGTKLRSVGPCLITHWGLSGPVILRLSAWGARELKETDYVFDVVINWCGESSLESVEAALVAARESAPKKRVRSGLPAFSMPARLWYRLAEDSGIGAEVTWSSLTRDDRKRFAKELVASQFRVKGQAMNKDEFVTAGGVALKEINFKTMESRKTPGLYFAGEVMDIDGITGGFNFQSAWTTARIAGESAAEALAVGQA
jgi:predicted Rossmann fold flavoprotein